MDGNLRRLERELEQNSGDVDLVKQVVMEHIRVGVTLSHLLPYIVNHRFDEEFLGFLDELELRDIITINKVDYEPDEEDRDTFPPQPQLSPSARLFAYWEILMYQPKVAFSEGICSVRERIVFPRHPADEWEAFECRAWLIRGYPAISSVDQEFLYTLQRQCHKEEGLPARHRTVLEVPLGFSRPNPENEPRKKREVYEFLFRDLAKEYAHEFILPKYGVQGEIPNSYRCSYSNLHKWSFKPPEPPGIILPLRLSSSLRFWEGGLAILLGSMIVGSDGSDYNTAESTARAYHFLEECG